MEGGDGVCLAALLSLADLFGEGIPLCAMYCTKPDMDGMLRPHDINTCYVVCCGNETNNG